MNPSLTIQPGSIISYQLPGTLKIWAGRVLLNVNGKIKVSILNAGYEELTEWIDVSFVIGVVHASSTDTTKHSS
jgi:hypothetical protein